MKQSIYLIYTRFARKRTRRARVMEKNCDFLVVGGGIVGLAITNELLLRGCSNIIVLEKEEGLGAHSVSISQSASTISPTGLADRSQ